MFSTLTSSHETFTRKSQNIDAATVAATADATDAIAIPICIAVAEGAWHTEFIVYLLQYMTSRLGIISLILEAKLVGDRAKDRERVREEERLRIVCLNVFLLFLV